MYDYVFLGGTLIDQFSLKENHCLAVSGGRIDFIDSPGRPLAHEYINAHGLYISPGLIDLHVHGGNGADSLDCCSDSIDHISLFHGKRGTTGIILSIGPASFEHMALALETAAESTGRESGANILGCHLEGPFLNPSYCGALDSSHFLRPDVKVANELLTAGRGNIKIVTLAPELHGCMEIIETFSSCGVIASLGHSDAGFEETMSAGAAGLRHITHIFNAMRGLHHREPGPAGAAFSSKDITIEVIADGWHVHHLFLKLLWQIKGKNLALTSDCIAAAGLPDGYYRFGGRSISVKGGKATLNNGRLAGGTITLLECVKTMVRLCGLTLPQAVYLASACPARILSLSRRGRLAPGFYADIILLDPEINPRLVMVGGRIIHRINV